MHFVLRARTAGMYGSSLQCALCLLKQAKNSANRLLRAVTQGKLRVEAVKGVSKIFNYSARLISVGKL